MRMARGACRCTRGASDALRFLAGRLPVTRSVPPIAGKPSATCRSKWRLQVVEAADLDDRPRQPVLGRVSKHGRRRFRGGG